MTNEEFYKKLLDNLFDGVYFVDRERTITYWNQGAERISGYTSEEVIGKSCAHNLLMHIDDEGNLLCKGDCPLFMTIQDGCHRSSEIYLHHKKGHRVPVWVRITPLLDPQGKIIGAVEVFSDNSSKIDALQRVEELEQMVYMDPLTGLANRRFVEMSLLNRYQEMLRYNWLFGVIFMDVDKFKQVNDTHGHEVGDKVLQMVARSIAGSARAFDVIGRWGGEEFIAILTNVGPKNLKRISNRFRVLVEQSYLMVDGHRISVTMSLGATLARPGDTHANILKRVDRLMYQSKGAGGNRITLDIDQN